MPGRHVAPCKRREMPFNRHFAGVHRQACNRSIQTRLFRDVRKQVIYGRSADGGEHRLPVGICQG